MSLSIRDEADDLASFVQLIVSEIMTAKYMLVSVLALLVYDAIIMLDKEVEFFWGKSNRKTVTFVYFVIRYAGLLGAIVPLLYYIYNIPLEIFASWSRNIFNWIVTILIDYILMIRVLALYSRDRRLSICLSTLLVSEAIAKLVLVIYGTRSGEISTPQLTQDTSICASMAFPPLFLGILSWTIPAVYGLLLMVLALYKAAEYWKASAGLEGFGLVKVLILDQAIYFLLTVYCCIVLVLSFKITQNNGFWSIVLQLSGNPSFFSLLGSRLLIHLKEAARTGLNEGTSYRLRPMSKMQFVDGDVREGSSDISGMP